ncbi:MAG: hypothetical protein ACLFS7_04000 [Desulfosudaceae bacterium]
MESSLFYNPALTLALTLALALLMGMIAQSPAHHLRVPGIVLLLAAGVAPGPDGAGWKTWTKKKSPPRSVILMRTKPDLLPDPDISRVDLAAAARRPR